MSPMAAAITLAILVVYIVAVGQAAQGDAGWLLAALVIGAIALVIRWRDR